MTDTFRAIRLAKTDSGQETQFVDLTEADLMEGDVTVRVAYSTVNFKDGLALTGKSPVVRVWPLTPGIDFSGTVESSSNPAFKAGDRVVLNGWGVGESHHGGYAQKARVKGDWLVALPKGFSTAQAMAVGTAGYTAMLCVMTLERHGLTPADGPVVVTGAAGGVGSIAIALLKKAGWHVIASTGRPDEADYLKALGADEIIDRNSLNMAGRPLNKERWAAGIDTVGSHTLANLLSQTKYGGAIAATGLAQGMDLPASVAPFILRNVSLLGVDSVMCPLPRRSAAWARLDSDLDRTKLASLTTDLAFGDVIAAAPTLLDGKLRGRAVVGLPA